MPCSRGPGLRRYAEPFEIPRQARNDRVGRDASDTILAECRMPIAGRRMPGGYQYPYADNSAKIRKDRVAFIATNI